MKRLLRIFCLAFACTGCVLAGPITNLVYSSFANYPPGPIGPLPGPYDSGTLILGSSYPPGYLGIAVPFVPKDTYDITFMDFALFYFAGTNSALVELRDSFYGVLPGQTLLGSWNVSGASGGLVGLPVSGRVNSGQQYWVTIQPGANDAELGWAFNNQGVTGDYSVTRNGSTYPDGCLDCTLPGFDILGNPVPEPSTLVLSLAGLALLLRGAGRLTRR